MKVELGAKKNFRTFFIAAIFVLTSCGGGGGGGSSTPTPAPTPTPTPTPIISNTVTLSGTVDNSTVVLASHEGFLKRFFAWFSPTPKAYAVTNARVNRIVAVSHDGTHVDAVKSGSSFSLSLEKGKPYVLALLNDASLVGLYRADAATGMEAFPITSSSKSFDVGTVSLLSGEAMGTVSSSSLLDSLGIDSITANAFGVMGKGLVRFANFDVDGNGIIDTDENKNFNIMIGFVFASSSFTASTGAWSRKEETQFWFYGFSYVSCPDDTTLNWANAQLNSPQSFQICNASWPVCDSGVPIVANNELPMVSQPFVANTQTCRQLNFYGGSRAIISPVPPPAGTYTISVPNILGTGTQTLTFSHVATPDISNMQNVYVPEIKLTKDANGKISLIEWRWWRKTGSTWIQPTDAELTAIMDGASFTIAGPGWSGNRVTGAMPITQTGSIVPSAQAEAAGAIMIGGVDKSQYGYAFDFR
jgi:hypothetical protein